MKMTKSIWNPATLDEITSNPQYAKAYDALQKKLVAHTGELNTIIKKAEIIIDNTSDEKNFSLAIEKSGVYILDVYLKEGCTHTFTYLNKASDTECSLTIARFHLEKGATLESTVGSFGGAHSTLFLETLLNGEESSVNEHTIFWADGDQIFDIFSTTTHYAKNTHSYVESKGIVHDHAAVRFDGKIHITKPARGSNARLIEHTLLLSPDAKMFAVPGLTIDTNDVVANHAASMTRIDDDQLFYCESRGIAEQDGKRLIAEGFLKSGELPDAVMSEIEPLIESKLNHL